MGLLTDFALIAKSHTSYDVGLMQAKGYRTLKQMTALVLKPEGLTTVEWAILGILSHHSTGLRASEIAGTLGVQPPLVSRLIVRAESDGWITIAQGEEDKRERVIRLSEKGRKGVSRIEKNVRKALIPLLKGIGPKDLAGYLRTLATIAENGKDIPPGTLEDYIPE